MSRGGGLSPHRLKTKATEMRSEATHRLAHDPNLNVMAKGLYNIQDSSTNLPTTQCVSPASPAERRVHEGQIAVTLTAITMRLEEVM